jgi:hypothetical protein
MSGAKPVGSSVADDNSILSQSIPSANHAALRLSYNVSMGCAVEQLLKLARENIVSGIGLIAQLPGKRQPEPSLPDAA